MMYNTLGLRIIALIIDNLVLLPLVLFGGQGDKMTIDAVIITTMVLTHTYFIIGHAQYGRTIGKKIMGVKVVSAHQHLPITWMQAIRRELLIILSSIAFLILHPVDPLSAPVVVTILSIPIFADALLALIHPQNRALRDFIAGTVVIRHVDVKPF